MQKKISTSLVASFLLATTNLYSVQNLETITVTSATKSDKSIQDVTSNVEVITKQEIEEKHFTTVVEALNTVSGISFVSNGGMGNTSNVYLRGMDSKGILVLESTDKAMVLPRVNDVVNDIISPYPGLMCYDITSKTIAFFDGKVWNYWK